MAVDEAASLERQVRMARARIRNMREMLEAANSLDGGAENDGDRRVVGEPGPFGHGWR